MINFNLKLKSREGGKDVISVLIKKEKREKLEEKVKRGENPKREEDNPFNIILNYMQW